MKMNIFTIKKDLESGNDEVYVKPKKQWNDEKNRYEQFEFTFTILDEEVYGYTLLKNNEVVKEGLTHSEAISYILDYLVTKQKELISAHTISKYSICGETRI